MFSSCDNFLVSRFLSSTTIRYWKMIQGKIVFQLKGKFCIWLLCLFCLKTIFCKFYFQCKLLLKWSLGWPSLELCVTKLASRRIIKFGRDCILHQVYFVLRCIFRCIFWLATSLFALYFVFDCILCLTVFCVSLYFVFDCILCFIVFCINRPVHNQLVLSPVKLKRGHFWFWLLVSQWVLWPELGVGGVEVFEHKA